MLQLPYRRKYDVWLSSTTRLNAATSKGIELATAKAASALCEGRLLSPLEALALAGPEARSRETLFSIARMVAWDTGGDQDEIWRALCSRFPDLI